MGEMVLKVEFNEMNGPIPTFNDGKCGKPLII